jgi:CII-binding regulator of phage lambda lysogenization HflD
MIIKQQTVDVMVDDKLETQPTDRFEVYQEVEKVGLDDNAVVIKELVGAFTKEEIEADCKNLQNSILDMQNQLRDKQSILSTISNLSK